jgi:hypothetical protein
MTDTSRRDLIKGAAAGAIAAGAVAALAGCTDGPHSGSAQSTGQQQTESAFKALQAAVPYPASELKDSVERRNLRERLLRYNVPTKLSYIYLLSDYGQVITYMPIHGKVSSANSQMTTSQLIEEYGGSSGGGNVVVDAPGDDGSYGPNEDGVFWFSTSGVMCQWNGKYLVVDAPLKLVGTSPVLVYDENSRPTSTSGR